MRAPSRTAQAGLLTTALCAALLLSACNKSADVPNAPDPKAQASGTAAVPAGPARTAEQATAKFNAYTAAYNKLIGTFGLPETRDRYFKENIASKKPADSVSITAGWLEQGLEALRQGRGLPTAGLDALDTSADAVIAPLGKLVPQLKALDVYYTSKAYKEDGLAKGKAQDAEVRGLFEATTTAMANFNKALGEEQKKRGAQALASLKANGEMLAYDTQLALQQGEELTAVFGSESDIRNPERFQQADNLVAALEKTLAEQRTQFEADKAKAKDKKPDSGHESVNGNLVSLIGEYRDLKQSRKAEDYNDMIKYYNRAVESSNGISR